MANERPSQAYAQAVFEKAMASWLGPLRTIAEVSAKSGLVQKVDDAGLGFAEKQALVDSVFPPDTHGEVRNLIYTLASKNELHLLPEIVTDLDQFSKRNMPLVATKITSAVPLTDPEKRSMEEKLRKQFGADAAFEYAVDSSILGGVVVRAGDKVIDGSVSGKLAALKEQLK